jgi:putative transposase
MDNKLSYHLVWCTKRKKPVLVGDIEHRLKELFFNFANRKGIEILSMDIYPNYVHLYVSAGPKIAPHKLVLGFKKSAYRPLRSEFPELKKIPSLWTENYLVTTGKRISRRKVDGFIKSEKRKREEATFYGSFSTQSSSMKRRIHGYS